MTAISPKPSSPGTPITEWDEGAVNTYLVSIGLGGYESVIYGAYPEPAALARSLARWPARQRAVAMKRSFSRRHQNFGHPPSPRTAHTHMRPSSPISVRAQCRTAVIDMGLCAR